MLRVRDKETHNINSSAVCEMQYMGFASDEVFLLFRLLEENTNYIVTRYVLRDLLSATNYLR